MISLLNRLAWLVSLALAMVILLTLLNNELMGLFDWFGLFFLIPIFILTAIIKGIFLPKLIIEKAYKDIGGVATVGESENEKQESVTVIQEEAMKESTGKMGEKPDISLTYAQTPTHKEIFEKHTPPPPPSKIFTALHTFFTDRPLAKVGGLLLFLGALFFLWLIFDAVGPVGKILVGIGFGFSLIGIGTWLDKKSIMTESRVLMGIGIAVNYLTILAGRHLLTDGIAQDPLFSDIFATVALTLNTLLAVVIALVYHSRVLLGFAFIFGYATPFLVKSGSSSTFLLVAYTTLLTFGIALITNIYAKMNQKEDIRFLEWIAVTGMTLLFSLAILDGKETSTLMTVFAGLTISVIFLSWLAYRQGRSPFLIFAGAYIVLFVASVGTQRDLFMTPLMTILTFGGVLFFFLLGSVNILLYSIFAGASFLWGIISYLSGGSEISILLLLGFFIFFNIGIAIWKTGSTLLSGLAIGGLSLVLLSTVSDIPFSLMTEDVLLMKGMSIILLFGASLFALRTKSSLLYFAGVIASGVLISVPDTFEKYRDLTLLGYLLFALISYTVPYLLIKKEGEMEGKSFLLASLPVSAIVVGYGIYQIGSREFPGIMLGVAYMIQSVISLLYAFIIGRMYFRENTLETMKTDDRNTLLVLFAIPLSLFTFALAFLFRDTPGVMSLAWMLESVILYLISTRMRDIRIFFFSSIVLLIGIMKQASLVSGLIGADWRSLGILGIMLVSIFASLFVLRHEERNERFFYDILHCVAVTSIAFGIGKIIPSTGTGWSVLSATALGFVLMSFYSLFGKKIHQVFLAIVLFTIFLLFMWRFPELSKDTPLPLMVQGSAVLLFIITGVVSYKQHSEFSSIHLGITLLGSLIISSWYVNEFFGTFAVSLYLTVIASILIIRGIVGNQPILRTIGLYIGIFILIKIFGSDIWYGSNTMITRVIALMGAGGVMIYLSQLYGKYVSRSWVEELSMGNIFPSEDVKGSSERPLGERDDPFIGELKEDLKNTDVHDIIRVRFVSETIDFTTKRASILRLAKRITVVKGKTTFAPNELADVAEYVPSNIASNLPKDELQKIIQTLRTWVKEGGTVEFTLKK